MDTKETREQLKGHLKEYVEMITEKSKGANMYVCPLCGSGTGQHGTGAFSIKDGISWKCFSCGESGDIFDLIGKKEGITEYKEQLQRAGELFNINTAPYKAAPQTDYKSAPRNQKQDKNEQYTQQHIHNNTYTKEAEQDYTSFFLQANKDIENTNYHRGITLETLNHFKVGYVKNWKNPNVPTAPASPRLIIPTSKHSYLARDTRQGVQEYSKLKVGGVRIFNSRVLRTAEKPIFIVEGELDALSIIDVGGEAIALGGTPNVKNFIDLLKAERRTFTQPFIISMDNDEPGENAAKALSEGLKSLNIPFYNFSVAPLGYKDANAALMDDREAFKKMVERGENIEAETLEAEREVLEKEAVLYSLPDFIKDIQESKNSPFFSTGFWELDSILDGGLYAGLYIVGAISSLGKTTFCLQIADQIAASGQDVLIFSLEMARNELIAKSVSRHTFQKVLEDGGDKKNAKTTRGILTGKRYPKYSQAERELIQSSIASYGEYGDKIFITEGIGNVGIEEIRNKVQKHIKLTGKAPVVLIDYLQIIAPSDIRATDKQNTDKAVLELKRLSRDCNIPVIGISSFNRDNYTAPVNLASFKESGAIEYSSDVLIGLQYDGMDYREGEKDGNRIKRIREVIREAEQQGRSGEAQKIQVKVLKNRNGSKGDTVLDFYPMFNYFREDLNEEASDESDSGNWEKTESSY